MTKDGRSKRFSRETILLAVGGTLFVIFLALIAYVFVFLVNNVLPAVTSDDTVDGGEIHFNIEGFEELRL